MTAIVINYNVLWLIISSIVGLIFAPPLWWIAYELHNQNALERQAQKYYAELDDGESGELAIDEAMVK